MNEICQEVNQENFEALFVEHSKQYPVLVVFWAPSFPDSVAILESVEKVAAKYSEKMIFSKVNCELYPQIAQQFNVKNLPTVVVVRDAQPVDGFAEMASEEKIGLFIENQFPKEWELVLQQALQLIEVQEFSQALALLQPVIEQSGNRHDVKMHVAHCLLETNQIVLAQEILNKVDYIEQDEHYNRLIALLDVKLQTQDSPELQLLQQQFEQSPDDVEILKTLAAKLSELGKYEDALDLMYQFMLNNKQETQMRVLYLDVIKMADAKIASKYQQKLYTLLY